MKSMMRKGGVYAAFAAVLLVLAMLVTGCQEVPESWGYQHQAGKGAVQLNLGETTRTIVPGTSISSFTKFDIQFTAIGSGAVSDSETNIPAANIAGPYDLEPGVYDITVIGYIDTLGAATGTANNVNIYAGQTTPSGTIYMEAYDPATASATDEGTFKWTISNSVTGLTSAVMNITAISGMGASSIPSVTLFSLTTSDWADFRSIQAGYYYVEFVLIANGSTRTFQHILHIYKGQTSEFTYTFDNSYFTFAKTNVTVDYTKPGDVKPVLQSNNAGTTAPVPENGTVTLSISNTIYPDEINIEVTNITPYGSNKIEWYLSTVTGKLTSGLTGSNEEILTVTAGTSPFNTQGLYRLTVVGIPTTGGPSSTTINISIVP